jgi:proteasome accessory factor B
MTDRPRPQGEAGAFTTPPDLDVAAAAQGPQPTDVEVELAVAPAARWAVELRGGRDTGRTHAGRPVLSVTGLHPLRDRSWILGLGPDVEVVSPPELRAAVIASLRTVAEGSA